MGLDELKDERLRKLKELVRANIDPYPAKSWRSHTIKQALENFDDLSGQKATVVLAGRVMAMRAHGAITFADINDGSSTIQTLFNTEHLSDREYELLTSTLDIGDFLEVQGPLFLTKRNERTVEVLKWRMLAKATRPLPEKWHGLVDVEERYRRRYLDLIFNDDVKKRFEMRFRIISSMRKFFAEHGYQEVETPILQVKPGGATARPFATHMNDLDIDLYLRVAPELYLKRLLVGGFERVFEIGKNFRNEGMDREHNPEFTMLEAYAAYKDHEWLMGLVEDLILELVTEVFGKPELDYEGTVISLKKPFRRIPFADIIKQYAGLEYDLADTDDFVRKANELGIQVEKAWTKAVLADEIYKKVARPLMMEPVFVVNHPLELSPLSKKSAPDSTTVARFQLLMAGMELCNAFSELNDPQDQRVRFEEQEKQRQAGSEEAQRLDEDFIEALEYGMPPAAGIGIGVDRLVALLTGAHSLRDVLLFPTMKPNA